MCGTIRLFLSLSVSFPIHTQQITVWRGEMINNSSKQSKILVISICLKCQYVFTAEPAILSGTIVIL